MKTRLRWLGHVERKLVDSLVRKVDQIEGSQITRDNGRPRKRIAELIKKDLEINKIDKICYKIEHYRVA